LRTKHGNADAAIAILNGEMLGQRHRGVLGHAIGHRVQRSQQACRGCGIQEITGASRQHARHQRTRGEHVAHDMHPPAHVPVGVRCGLLTLAGEAGVGEEHVNRPIFGLGRRDQRLDVFFLTDVGGHRQRVDVAGDLRKAVAR
jgi:hypothetical protein